MANDTLLTHLLDLFDPLAEVTARRMFGAHGLFRHGLMFGILDSGVLYLKVDDASRSEFESRGLSPFTYGRDSKRVSLGYYEAPPEALESRRALTPWADRAFEAALKSARRSKSKA